MQVIEGNMDKWKIFGHDGEGYVWWAASFRPLAEMSAEQGCSLESAFDDKRDGWSTLAILSKMQGLEDLDWYWTITFFWHLENISKRGSSVIDWGKSTR